MTASVTLTATQPANGAPITFSVRVLSGSITDYDAWNGAYVIVTTSNVAPATFGAATHADEIDTDVAFVDSGSRQQTVQRSPGDTIVSFSDSETFSKFLRLDSNYVAGRYVWGAIFATTTPAGSDAPLAVSQSYLIR